MLHKFQFPLFFLPNNTILLLFAVFDEYKRISQKDIEQSIKSETSGSFEDALLAIGKLVGGVEKQMSIDFSLSLSTCNMGI